MRTSALFFPQQGSSLSGCWSYSEQLKADVWRRGGQPEPGRGRLGLEDQAFSEPGCCGATHQEEEDRIWMKHQQETRENTPGPDKVKGDTRGFEVWETYYCGFSALCWV